MKKQYGFTIVAVLACLVTGILASTGTSVEQAPAQPGLSTAAPPDQPQQHEPWVTEDAEYFDQREIPFDAPWPRVGPLETAPPVRVIRGSFESVQVNVDENGNNIVGDAANEPSIALDPTDADRIVIGWRQFDDVRSDFRQSGYGYSHDSGRTWTFPGSLWPGRFGSDPVLGADADGVFYYMAIGNDNPGVRLFRSFDGGVKWEGPIRVLAAFRDKQWFAIDRTEGIGRGNIYATWTDYSNFTRSTDGGDTWMNPIRAPIGQTVWGTLDVDVEGKLYLVDRNFTVAASTNAQDPNQTPTFPQVRRANLGGVIRGWGGPNPGGLLGQPWIVTDRSDGPARGNVYLLCSVDPPGNDPLDVMFARSTDGGVNWTAPVRVNDESDGANAWQWFGTMSVAPSGRIDAFWYDTRNSGRDNLSEAFYAYSTDTGDTWSANIQVSPVFDSHVGWPRQNKIGDYTGMFSDALGAGVAYAATFNNEQDVYFLRIDIDCNKNGQHDGDDIASGRSKDVNGNGIPDECEGVNCDLIRKFKVKCRGGKLKVKVKSKQPEGTLITIDNNGDERVLTLNDKGKAKTKWTGQTGKHTVKIAECPDFEEVVDCGQ